MAAFQATTLARSTEVATLPAYISPPLVDDTALLEVKPSSSMIYPRLIRDGPHGDEKRTFIQWQYQFTLDNFVLSYVFGPSNQSLFVTFEADMYSDYNVPTGEEPITFLDFNLGRQFASTVYSYATRVQDLYHPGEEPLTYRWFGIFEIPLKYLKDSLSGALTLKCGVSADASYYAVGTSCRMTILSKTFNVVLKAGAGGAPSLGPLNKPTPDLDACSGDHDWVRLG